jgi:hypothetical protein
MAVPDWQDFVAGERPGAPGSAQFAVVTTKFGEFSASAATTVANSPAGVD